MLKAEFRFLSGIPIMFLVVQSPSLNLGSAKLTSSILRTSSRCIKTFLKTYSKFLILKPALRGGRPLVVPVEKWWIDKYQYCALNWKSKSVQTDFTSKIM